AVAIVTPFNFPLEIPALQLMGALYMGNFPILKVDEKVAVVMDQFLRLLHKVAVVMDQFLRLLHKFLRLLHKVTSLPPKP
ncbi:hypothetical protein T484DRAFT_1864441, partial [Baffinella frigidus]